MPVRVILNVEPLTTQPIDKLATSLLFPQEDLDLNNDLLFWFETVISKMGRGQIAQREFVHGVGGLEHLVDTLSKKVTT